MKVWEIINRRLVAKGIAELSYEQVLNPVYLGGGQYRLKLSEGISYHFEAWRTVWDFLRIRPDSLKRRPALPHWRADQFYYDIKAQHGMSDTTLANFLEELYRTQWSDLKAFERQETFKDSDLLSLSDSLLQTILDGHPKALVNKGRMGWSLSDLEAFAPESAEPFTLRWIAVRKDLVIEEFAAGYDAETRLRQTMGKDESDRLQGTLESIAGDYERFSLIPVHPWQWNEVLTFQFQNEIQEGAIVDLGEFGDTYRPQTSLRTLSNEQDGRRLQIKLPVSILNTSCVRGIDGRYIPISPKLTEIIRELSKNDRRLQSLVVLGDVSGAFVPHSQYAKLAEAPYRFQEFLGAIWRESPQSLLEESERCILTAALLHKPENQKGLLSQIIGRSGLAPESWMQAYFERVVIPLYHLQLKYGIGLVSHGQNIMLTLKDHQPSRLVIKDFQGDLRILDRDIPELSAFPVEIKNSLTRLPAHYLIHDLLTGHFVTVLRFMSAQVEEDIGFKEKDFYRLLANAIRSYHETVPEYRDRIDALGLLAPRIPRVLVNKVRFHIGYGDSALRPVPMVGTDLQNPPYE